jgi:predicted enzyme related to lactoylglutathione lyase
MTTTGLDFLAIQVRDLERAADFYEHGLGLQRADAGPPHAVVFATEPIPFAVREPLVDLDAVAAVGHGVAPWFHCDDADALCERLRAQGATIAAEPSDSPFGRTFAVIDPDGYRIVLHDG